MSDPLNNLPEYEVRTMKDDLELPRPVAAPPDKLPIVEKAPILKAPLPSIEEFVSKTKPISLAPPIIEPEKPKEKPVVSAKRVEKVKPPKPLKIKKIILPEIRAKRRKRALIILIIVIVIVGLGWFFYWQGTKPEPLPPPSPVIEELEVPEPIIEVDNTQKIFLQNTSLLTTLKAEAKLEQTAQTFERIVPIKGEKEILSLNNLIQGLRIAVYPYVQSELKDNYTLVFYGQDGKRRLGLIIEAIDSNKLKDQLKFWEKTMLDDLKNLFLDENLGEPTSKTFNDNLYKDIAIRYINLPGQDLTIDYAVSGNLLLLSTSKESMYQIIDRIK